jgi:hypothetical protein
LELDGRLLLSMWADKQSRVLPLHLMVLLQL